MPTPYEIREQLLSKATDYLTCKFHAEFQLADTLKDQKALKSLSYPSIEDIMALAETYKNFIDKK
jgi:hypothetical protein